MEIINIMVGTVDLSRACHLVGATDIHSADKDQISVFNINGMMIDSSAGIGNAIVTKVIAK